VEAELVGFGKDTARVVNANKQGYDVPLTRLPGTATIGDRFIMTFGPEDPNRETPEIVDVRPVSRTRPAAAGGRGGGGGGGVTHDVGRATAAFGKVVGGLATFGTPAAQPTMELIGATGYTTGKATAHALPAVCRRVAAKMKNWQKDDDKP